MGTCFVGSADEEEPKKGRIIVLSVPSSGPVGVAGKAEVDKGVRGS